MLLDDYHSGVHHELAHYAHCALIGPSQCYVRGFVAAERERNLHIKLFLLCNKYLDDVKSSSTASTIGIEVICKLPKRLLEK